MCATKLPSLSGGITQPSCFQGLRTFFLKPSGRSHRKYCRHSSVQQPYQQVISGSNVDVLPVLEQLNAIKCASRSPSAFRLYTRVDGFPVSAMSKPSSTNRFFTRSIVFMLTFKTRAIVSLIDRLSDICLHHMPIKSRHSAWFEQHASPCC